MRIAIGKQIRVNKPEPELLAWCKKNLILRNPEYIKKQRMNLWLGDTPKTFTLMEWDGDTVLEMKTTKRAEDWADDIPEYYALQAALYAYLLGVDDVIMVASFLEDSDYHDPSKFVCKGGNTITRPFKVSERYPNFEKRYVKPALKWWHDHVETGISPAFDEKKDADILKVLRTNNVSPETDIAAMVKEAEELKAHIDSVQATVAEDEKRYLWFTGDGKRNHFQNEYKGGEVWDWSLPSPYES